MQETGGNIKVENSGEGTTFTLEFPRDAQEDEKESEEDEYEYKTLDLTEIE